jgi:hypothetical protein
LEKVIAAPFIFERGCDCSRLQWMIESYDCYESLQKEMLQESAQKENS